MFKLGLISLVAACLLACGGSSSTDDFALAVASANAKEAEARSLASDSPCDQVQQCSVLTFALISPACGSYGYKPYSLVSTNSSAASAASGQQRELARQANQIAPSSGIACAAVINPEPALVCVLGKCAAAS
jgi:hypothetical protein